MVAWDGVGKNTHKKFFQSINQRVDLELRPVLAYYPYTTQYVFLRHYLVRMQKRGLEFEREYSWEIEDYMYV